MGGGGEMSGGDEKCVDIKIVFGVLEGKIPLGDLGTGERIMSKLFLKK
jgi:hypothetical protein